MFFKRTFKFLVSSFTWNFKFVVKGVINYKNQTVMKLYNVWKEIIKSDEYNLIKIKRFSFNNKNVKFEPFHISKSNKKIKRKNTL